MTIYLINMFTDGTLVGTQLHSSWGPHREYEWHEVYPARVGRFAGGSTIVVIAHGSGEEIGNEKPKTGVDLSPRKFLNIIAGNMSTGAMPYALYVSTCGTGIAAFPGNLANYIDSGAAGDDWKGVELWGHRDPVDGAVPPRNDVRWQQIFTAGSRLRSGKRPGAIPSGSNPKKRRP
jgi:hypothetical protein